MTDIPAENSASEPRSVFGFVAGPIAGLLAKLAVISLFINALSLGAPVFTLQVYDRVVPYAGVETLKALAIAALLAIGFDFALRQARSRMVQMVAMRVDISLTRALFGKITGLPLRDLEARTEAEWRTLLRDGETVRDTVAGPTVALMVDLPFAMLFIGVIALAAPPLAWALTGLAVVCAFLAALSSLLIGRSSKAEQDAALDRHAMLGEVVAGRATVKALNLGEHLRGRWEQAQARVIRWSLKRGAQVDGFNNIGAGIGTLSTVLLTSVGAVAIIQQDMSIGGLMAANMLAARVVQPLTQLIGLWRGLQRFRDSARRLDAVLGLASERAESAVAMERPTGALTLENVCFGYDAAAPMLTRISCTLKSGAMHGIVGPNGCGKSTLLKLAQGLYQPDSGRVLLDGADLAQFGRRDLARWIGYAPQEAFLLSGTIRDAIAKGRDDLDDETIRRAAGLVAARDLIAELPDGFGARVGEGGRRFSPGERQRLALARALVDDPAVLLLDEPSAHLDTEAERALRDQLTRLKQDRNIVVATHSRALLEACDDILVLNGGRVAMFGRAEDVLSRLFPPSPAEARGPKTVKREELSA